MYKAKLFSVVPAIPERLERLRELAYNLWWSWNPDATALFARLDRQLWNGLKRNPVALLSKINQKTLNEAAEDPAFLSHLDRVVAALDHYLGARTWIAKHFPHLTSSRIAYFSAEFGLHECLPTYSGGLGVLAGDHLKSASDLGLPLVGVTLLYRQGYFSQYLSNDGWQFEEYPVLDLQHLPIQPALDRDGAPLRVWLDLADHSIVCRIWQVAVGRCKLLLMDTDCPENNEQDRLIVSRLYAGDQEMRIRQEVVLGFGGYRALLAMGEEPHVCHINEGHSAFLVIERVRSLVQSQALTLAEACEAVTASTLFTTHTPVPAGIDTFPLGLTEKYLRPYAAALSVPVERLLALGQVGTYSPDRPFSMAILALTTARQSNGVSRIHGEVAREMWQSVWPGVPADEVPLIHITNGVHIQSWLSQDMARLLDRYLGPSWVENPVDERIWEHVSEIPDEELWRVHETLRGHLVSRARRHVKAQLERRGAPLSEIAQAEELLNPEALTLGFARRFAAYKRATLFLRDEARLLKLLADTDRPVQLVIAGKAHPRDNIGKELIKGIVQFARRANVSHRLVFLEDYDIGVARFLVQGVDVWLNNPIKRLEASGTSGMKVAPNGGINMSVLDGWWPEGYDGSNGWAIGDNRTYDNPDYQNFVESESIYDLLESEVIPLFYDRGPDGLPRKWIARMKASMRTCVPKFSANRMVREYVERMYIPAAQRWRHLGESEFKAVRSLTAWKSNLTRRWGNVKIESFESTNGAEHAAGSELHVNARIHLGDIAPDEVAVELYYGPAEGHGGIREGHAVPMQCASTDGQGNYAYSGAVRCESTGQQAFTVRVVPHHPDLHGRFEMGLVTWG